MGAVGDLQLQINRFAHNAGFSPIAYDGVYGNQTANAAGTVAHYIYVYLDKLTIPERLIYTPVMSEVSGSTAYPGGVNAWYTMIKDRAGTLATMFANFAARVGFPVWKPSGSGPSPSSPVVGGKGGGATSAGSTDSTLVVVGIAAIAAYFLFFNKKKGSRKRSR